MLCAAWFFRACRYTRHSEGDTYMKLTDTFLRSLKPTGKVQKHFDGGGLYLYLSPTGGKAWRMDFR
jgi:hypothetical protein